MFNQLFVYEKMENIFISPSFIKSREDLETNFLIVMSEQLTLSYFNGSSKDIVEFIIKSKKCYVSDIFNYMMGEYDINEKNLKIDIIDFIRDLQWKKLINLSIN